MREYLDCGVLIVPAFEKRIRAFIETVNVNTQKLNLYPVSLTEDGCSADAFSVQEQFQESYPDPSVLSNLSQRLQRFDFILLPVSQDSLVWSRMLLQQTHTSLLPPVVALTREIHPVAMYDLVCLGVADFAFEPDNIEELRVRLLMIMRHANEKQLLDGLMPPLLQDKIRGDTHRIINSAKSASKSITPVFGAETCCKELANQAKSYKEAKSVVVAHFEQFYITNALFRCGGNIAMAARASEKHRRAFWALMQKHGIKADSFKDMV